MSITQRLLQLIAGRKKIIPSPTVELQVAAPVADFIDKLPKAEIHLHFEGAINAETILALAQKHHDPQIKNYNDAQWLLYFSNPHEFFKNFLYLSSLFREAEDFYDVALALGKQLYDQNILYAELTIAPHKFMRSGIPYPELMEAMARGLSDSPGADQREHRFIIDIVRDLGSQIGMEMIREVERYHRPDVVGVGLGGSENFRPEDSSEVFRYAESIGLRKTAHAGEGLGAGSIWGTIKSLGVERIDHGVRAGEDAELVKYLIEHRIPLNQCLTSNVMLGVVRELDQHPFRSYWDQGVVLTIGTDDPAFFKTTLSEELKKLAIHQDFKPEEMPTLMENAINVSFMDQADKSKWITRFRAESEPLLEAMHEALRSSGES